MEVAIPLIALGSMYVISKQNKQTKNSSDIEGYANMTQIRNALPGVNPPTPAINYPIDEPVTNANTTSAYINPNQYSDKYFCKSIFYIHNSYTLLTRKRNNA